VHNEDDQADSDEQGGGHGAEVEVLNTELAATAGCMPPDRVVLLGP